MMLAAGLVLVGCGKKQALYPESGGAVEPVAAMDGLSREIAREVRSYRAQNGRSPLSWDSSLASAAQAHSMAMGTGAIPLGHHNFDARKAEMSKNMSFVSGMAENVGLLSYGNGDVRSLAKQMVRLWAGSPKHKKNMLGDFNITGVGAVRTQGGKVYVTQIFANVGR